MKARLRCAKSEKMAVFDEKNVAAASPENFCSRNFQFLLQKISFSAAETKRFRCRKKQKIGHKFQFSFAGRNANFQKISMWFSVAMA
ncbi:MAG: hypothetical protein KBT12_02795 [Bacteroidales bacterium]|nr:hypothetical protein [Candidatus Physcousia equi]